MNDKSIIIIGGGFAGLSAGIYALLNGYKTEIFEMQAKPGGLCTSWNRDGYTFDGCVRWLIGSSPKSGLHDMWEETGVSQGREFINMEEYIRVEDSSGRTLIFYTDINRLEKHLLEFSPQDKKPIMEFIDGMRLCLRLDTPSKHDPFLKRLGKNVSAAINFMQHIRKMKYWMKTTIISFSEQFKDPVLREVFKEIWIPQFPMFFLLFTFAYFNNKNAGYPLGGSLPMSEALETRYKELGGIIHYNSRVKKILTAVDKAVGIRLEDNTEHLAGRVISAADGHKTLFSMLDGKFINGKTHDIYEKWETFPSIIFVSLGVNYKFEDIPYSVSGLLLNLKQPSLIGDAFRNWLPVRIHHHDPALAPEGRTSITLMLDTDYSYWKKLSDDRAAYLRKKDETGNIIIGLLEQRFPGISKQVEVTDVATPVTFEHYTGNWKGAYEGWLLTPGNADAIMNPMPQALPDLNNFYMCGHWVEPGGGLPMSVMSGKRLIKKICKEDQSKFKC
jgi:phytoene dehydrogenase-like protein